MTTYFIVVADSGGGSDGNPFDSLRAAQADIEGETGVEIWEIDTRQYGAYSNGERDISDIGTLAWSCWLTDAEQAAADLADELETQQDAIE